MGEQELEQLRQSFAESYARLLTPFTIFVCFAAWVIAFLAGPVGTYEAMSWPVRGGYWGVVVVTATLIGFCVRAVCVVVIPQTRPFWADIGAAFVMTVIYAPIVYAFRSFAASYSDGLLVNPATITMNTFVISSAFFVLRRHVVPEEPGRYLLPDDEGSVPAHLTEAPRLMRRLDKELQSPILRLTASDHHVDVVTERGSQTLRIRFTDAIDEMEPVEGMCIHRSHWVTQAAIQGVERENAHKIFVVLTNGDRVPVSRKYRPNLEDKGIIARE